MLRSAKIHEIHIFGTQNNIQKVFQMPITFAIIKERKTPPDRRVVFSPQKCQEVQKQFPDAHIIVEASNIRVFQTRHIAKQVLR